MPNLERRVEDGILFERHYSNAPHTRQSVSQIFTSWIVTPMLMGTEHSAPASRKIPGDMMVLPGAFRDSGYHTAIVSSHPWFSNSARVLRYFDEKFVVEPKKGEKRHYAEFGRLMDPIEGLVERRRKGDEPFFLYVHSMDTHAPYRFHDGFDSWKDDGNWRRAYDKYDSEAAYTDHHLEKIFELLEKSGLADRTIVIFTSDHGEEFNEMGGGWSNRTHGSNLRPAVTHVPLIVWLPGEKSPRGRYRASTQHVDLAPTLLGLARTGFDLDPRSVDGRDLSARLWKGDMGRREEEGTAIANNSRYWALRSGENPGVEGHYDKWRQVVDLYEIRPDRYNYPRPVPIENPEIEALYSSGLERARRVLPKKISKLLKIPRRRRSGKLGLGSFYPRLSDGAPTFEASFSDDLWRIRPGRFLECGVGEKPPKIVMKHGLASGNYRLWLLLSERRRHRRFENSLVVRLLDREGTELVSTRVPPGSSRKVELGEVEVSSDSLFVELSQPQGGVAVTGLQSAAIEAGGSVQPEEKVDPAITERLRALGYVE